MAPAAVTRKAHLSRKSPQEACPEAASLVVKSYWHSEIQVAKEGKAPPAVKNIMAALKESVQAKGGAKMRDVVRKRMSKAAPKEVARPKPRPSPPRSAH
jgi:hypothetical protein